jgi:hypothetical protein
MPFTALLHDSPNEEAVSPKPHRTRLEATATRVCGTTQAVIVHYLSTHGALVEAYQPLIADRRITLDIPDLGKVRARVSWQGDSLYGCEFLGMLDDAEVRRKVTSQKIVWGEFRKQPAAGADKPATPARLLLSPLPSADPDYFGAATDSRDRRWSWPARAALIIGSGALAWLVPSAIVYALVT